MGETTKEDIRESRRDKQKALSHEESIEVCETDRCRELKRKLKKTEAEDRIED